MTRVRVPAVASIAALLLVFAALALSAAGTKSPTFDEPLHLVGAFAHRHHRDFRIDMEDPPLSHYWALLATRSADLRFPRDDPLWRDMPADYEAQWPYAHAVLYGMSGNDPDALFARTRWMMTALGVLLGAATAWLAWRLGGPVAALVAVALLAFDPNFLAHAPLLKNDVALTLSLVGVAAGGWVVGRRVTPAGVVGLGLACGAALATKYSGMLAAPLVATLLGGRALLPQRWPVLGGDLYTRRSRLAAAAGVAAVAGALAYGSLWAAYGFRYRAIPDGRPLNFSRLAAEVALFRVAGTAGAGTIDLDDAARLPQDLPTRTVLWLARQRLLPEAWLAGLLFTHGRSQARGTFVLGHSANEGVWYYFPLAMLVKTPTATLLLVAGAIVLAARRRPRTFESTWAAVTLVLPAALYLAAAMTSRLNLGLRHVLPVYPFLFIAVGVVAARLLRRARQWSVLAALLLLVALESTAAWPSFLAFFNLPAGGARGGLSLLADSNLDWGQDLPLLAAWQRAHPDVPLWLAYFGTADPTHYGIVYENLTRGPADGGEPNLGGYLFGPPGRRFDPDHGDRGVLAVSATHLQGVYLDMDVYADLRERAPLAVLGGTIYLYGPFGPPR